MGTPLQNQSNAILNAFEEGTVITIINLYDEGSLMEIGRDKRETIAYYIRLVGFKNQDSIDYWLNYYNVTP